MPRVLASWDIKEPWDGDWEKPYATIELLANPRIDYASPEQKVVGYSQHGLLWCHGLNGGFHLTEPEEALTVELADAWLEQQWPGCYERCCLDSAEIDLVGD
jgi:hypothetical protein